MIYWEYYNPITCALWETELNEKSSSTQYKVLLPGLLERLIVHKVSTAANTVCT